MPELPEVETVVRDLYTAGLVGSTIRAVTLRWHKTLDRPSIEEARLRLVGESITGLGRRGKYILIYLSGGDTLIVHLRMTGQLDVQAEATPLDPHHHITLTLDDGRELRFRDTRKFGRFYLVSDPAEVIGKLGPEPIDSDFTFEGMKARLAKRHRQLKPLLLDQTIVAGLGNIYVDEALWRAKLHPERLADTLKEAELTALFEAMRVVLELGISNSGTSLGEGSTNYLSVAGRRGSNKQNLQVFRRTGLPCPRCGTPIQRLVVGQRATHICPVCQVNPVA
jgi:formamidopyrimidine-DNA glycosylase